MRYLMLVIGIAAITFLLASLGFLLASSLFGNAFGGLYRMFMYHEKHPFQYIGVVSIVFGFLGSAWFCRCRDLQGWKRWGSIFATILFTILIASVPGGVLWKIHDMHAGYFPQGSRFWSDLLWGAKEGLLSGWLVVLTSVPYNLVGFAGGALLLHKLPSIVARLQSTPEKRPGSRRH